MKKIRIPLTIAITAVFLVLSGCDAILEAFYPEFAYSKGDTNVISIWAQFDMYPSEISGGSQYIAGRVIETKSDDVVSELGVEPFWNWIEEKNLIYWHLEGNLDFYRIEDGEYEVLVWLEQNGNNEPDGPPYEPWTYAKVSGEGSISFTLPNQNSAGGWLYGEAIVPLE